MTRIFTLIAICAIAATLTAQEKWHYKNAAGIVLKTFNSEKECQEQIQRDINASGINAYSFCTTEPQRTGPGIS